MKYDQLIDVRLLPPLATVIGILVSIVLWVLNQRKKQLSYRILWQGLLSKAAPEVIDRLLNRFDGEPTSELGLLVVQVVNSGHLPISPSDFQSRLVISAGPGAKVLFTNISSTSPGDLDDRCRTAAGEKKSLIDGFSGHEVVLTPILLNQGDSVTVQIIAEKLRGGVKVIGHINGIRRISLWRAPTAASSAMINIGAIVMALSALLVEPTAVAKFGFSEALAGLLFFCVGYTILIAGIYGRSKTGSTVMIHMGALVMALSMLYVEPGAMVQFGLSEGLYGVVFLIIGYMVLTVGIHRKPKSATADMGAA